jgi:radical SAM protein with 4Fe4S-binding SPASM domain
VARDVTAIRSVQRGHTPNCSSAGSVVGLALLSVVGCAVVVNAWADRFFARLDGKPRAPEAPEGGPPDPPQAVSFFVRPSTVRARREVGGAIVAMTDPPALLHVDEAVADRVGAQWRGAPVPGALTAPTEVHVAVTARCPVRCTACYLDAGPEVARGDPKGLDAVLEQLARAGVFEVAFGGGEALARADLVELAATARRLGLVPNVTTSGVGLTAALAARLAAVCGQINVSLDGLGPYYEAVRGWDGAAVALAAIDTLRAAGARVGVNTVICSKNLDHLPDLALALAARGVTDWTWLRLKPSGRGAAAYADLVVDPERMLELLPLALDFEQRGLAVRFDCALVPFLVAHGPPVEALARLGVRGCPGGHSLLAVDTEGRLAPCSFAVGSAAASVAEGWRDDPTLRAWRDRAAAPPEPCASCEARAICRGGCRIVAEHLTGDPLAPDPECPRVRRWAA